jgi:hypothetical protein
MIFNASAPATADRTITFPDPVNAAPNVVYWDSAAASLATMVQNLGAAPTIYIKASTGAAQLIIDSATGSNTQNVMAISGTAYWNLQTINSNKACRLFHFTSGRVPITFLGSGAFVGIFNNAPSVALDVTGTARASTQLICSATTSQLALGTTNTTTITSPAPTASRIVTLQDAGADSRIVLATGSTTVAQATSNTTDVTLNETSGFITSFGSYTLGSGASSEFNLVSSKITTTSIVMAFIESYSGTWTTDGLPHVVAHTQIAGSCKIRVMNIHKSASLNGSITVKFLIC